MTWRYLIFDWIKFHSNQKKLFDYNNIYQLSISDYSLSEKY